MIDIELIREKPEFVIQSFKRRGKELPFAEISDLDQRRRTAIAEMDSLRSRRNVVSVSYTHLTLPTILLV